MPTTPKNVSTTINYVLPFKLSCVLLLIALSFQVHSQQHIIKVGVFSDQLTLLENLTHTQDCPEISASNIGENQMLLEYLIICNLLKNSDTQVDFVVEGYPVVPRLITALSEGDIDISGFGIWRNESKGYGLIRSQPLLKPFQFSKGLYVTEQTLNKLEQQPVINVKSMVAVSNHNWTYDWQLLNCEFEHVLHIDRYQQMFQMLALKRADVLPLAFGKNAQMTREEFGITLYPLKGMKLAFPDSTHILISPKTVNATRIKDHINTELTKLRAKQKLTSWYNNIGVIKQQVSEWRGLCARY